MTPEQYRSHARLGRAFRRGESAAEMGRAISDNPYLKVHGRAKARRGSWTEAYASAWAAGFQAAAAASAPALSGSAKE